MAKRTKPYAFGRVWLFANIDSVRHDLAAGLTLRSIHAKHRAVGMSYSGFAKLVTRYVGEARPVLSRHQETLQNHERKNPRDNHAGGTAPDPELIKKLIHGE